MSFLRVFLVIFLAGGKISIEGIAASDRQKNDFSGQIRNGDFCRVKTDALEHAASFHTFQ